MIALCMLKRIKLTFCRSDKKLFRDKLIIRLNGKRCDCLIPIVYDFSRYNQNTLI